MIFTVQQYKTLSSIYMFIENDKRDYREVVSFEV